MTEVEDTEDNDIDMKSSQKGHEKKRVKLKKWQKKAEKKGIQIVMSKEMEQEDF